MNEDTDHGFIKRICYDVDGKETGIPSEEPGVRIEETKLFPAAVEDIPMQMGFDFN